VCAPSGRARALTGSGAQTVEAFFVLWRTTREPVWRERGWAVFEALERAARTRVGFASLSYADAALPPRKDDMPRCVLRLAARARRVC
jgi:hypothetical protein